MSMSKKDFIALADALKAAGVGSVNFAPGVAPFHAGIVEALADFCQQQNPLFKRDRWLGYLTGQNGPGGGQIRKGA